MTQTDTIKILLVEDEAIIAMSQAQDLSNMGYQVATVYSGEQAIDAACNDYSLDLILMDIDLGRGIDGTEAAQEILRDHHVPIVFLSSHTEPEMLEKVRGITRYGYILKSSGGFIIQQAINTALELDAVYREKEAQRRALDDHLEHLQRAHIQLQEREETLTRSNRSLRISRRVTRATETVRDDLEFVQEFCTALHEEGGYVLVWVAAIAHKPRPVLLPLASAGRDDGYTEQLEIVLDDPVRARGPAAQVVRTTVPAIVRDIETDPRFGPWRESAGMRDLRSVAVYPVFRNREIWGVYAVYSSRPDAFDSQERETLAQLAGELSFALEAIHSRQERAAMQELLSRERYELGERVKELRCISQLSEIAERPDIEPTTLIREVAEIVPPAFQFPDRTGVVIALRDTTASSGIPDSEAIVSRRSEAIIVNGIEMGRVEVYVAAHEGGAAATGTGRLANRGAAATWAGRTAGRDATSDTIIPEEATLIRIIATRLGRVVERIENLSRERETERRLQLVLDGSRIGSWEWDVATGKIEIDARWAEMLGYDLHELSPMDRRRWGNMCHPADREDAVHQLALHLRGESAFFSVEIRMLHKVGDWRWILTQAQVVEHDDVGKPRRVLGTHTDITRIKESEQSGLAEATQAMEVIRTKDLLMHEMHHRIKNDLNLIRSLFSLQASSARNAETRKVLSEAGNRVTAIARIYESLYHGDDLQFVRVGPLVSTIVRDLRSGVAAGTVEIELEIEDCAVPRRASISVGLIVNELVTNALKYSRGGDKPSTLTISVSPKDHRTIALTVRDDGPGFPEEVLSGGTHGFGLMVVKALAHQHGGTARITNDPGARIDITLRTED